MSEELLQIKPLELGRYSYLKLGSTTLAQLRRNKIISGSLTSYERKKPDGLILSLDGSVKAFIEYKLPAEFKTKAQQLKAVKQEIEVAKALCKVYIVTDGQTTLWINPLSGNAIKDSDGIPITHVVDVLGFHPGGLSSEEVRTFEELLDMAESSLDSANDTLSSPRLLDPTPLAQALWQLIWINLSVKKSWACLGSFGMRP